MKKLIAICIILYWIVGCDNTESLDKEKLQHSEDSTGNKNEKIVETKSVSDTTIHRIHISEVNIELSYPQGELVLDQPYKFHRPGRGGSVTSVTFLNRYNNFRLDEILFHTVESCSVFAATYENYDEGYPKRWYSPDVLLEHKNAFAKQLTIDGYNRVELENSLSFYNSCYYSEPGGYHIAECFTFLKNTRITIVFSSNESCHGLEQESIHLQNRIEFRAL